MLCQALIFSKFLADKSKEIASSPTHLGNELGPPEVS